MGYLNKATKEIVINFAGFAEYMDLLMEADTKAVEPHRKKMKTAATYLRNITRDITKDLAPDQHRFLKNQSDNSRIILVPKEDVRLKKVYTVIPTAVLSRLVNSAWGECLFCPKQGKEARECRLRADLLECGAMARDNGKGECPFKSGVV